jgi:hypothetical protein
MRHRTLVMLAIASVLGASPSRAQVRSLTVGIQSTCPYGLPA